MASFHNRITSDTMATWPNGLRFERMQVKTKTTKLGMSTSSCARSKFPSSTCKSCQNWLVSVRTWSSHHHSPPPSANRRKSWTPPSLQSSQMTETPRVSWTHSKTRICPTYITHLLQGHLLSKTCCRSQKTSCKLIRPQKQQMHSRQPSRSLWLTPSTSAPPKISDQLCLRAKIHEMTLVLAATSTCFRLKRSRKSNRV